MRICRLLAGASLLLVTFAAPAAALDQRDEVGHLNGPYNLAFYNRHNAAYRISTVIHIAHGVQHDILQLTPMREHAEVDMETDAEAVCTGRAGRPRRG